MKQLDVHLRAVRAGTMTFDRFARTSRDFWQGLASNIWRRWDRPSWVGSEDVQQDLLLNAWLYIPRSRDDEPGKPSLARFVVWNSVNRAQKRLRAIRNGGKRSHRDVDCEGLPLRARYEIPFSSFTAEDGEEITPLRFFGEAASQHGVAERRQALRCAALNSQTMQDRLVLAALSTCDAAIPEAASRLYENAEARLLLRLDNEAAAMAAIAMTIIARSH